jgi:hypothetical protein
MCKKQLERYYDEVYCIEIQFEDNRVLGGSSELTVN